MHPRVEEFRERARERYGLEPAVEEFPEGTKTAADAAAAIGCDVAQIASSIAVSTAPPNSSSNSNSNASNGDDDDGLAVVVTSGANRVDLDRVADLLEVASASMADADEIRETLGWAIGGVPPFCHEAEVPVLVDDTLFEHETVWAAAGTPQAVFPIAPEELLEYAGGRRETVHERGQE